MLSFDGPWTAGSLCPLGCSYDALDADTKDPDSRFSGDSFGLFLEHAPAPLGGVQDRACTLQCTGSFRPGSLKTEP
jgi:hypothetical protein